MRGPQAFVTFCYLAVLGTTALAFATDGRAASSKSAPFSAEPGSDSALTRSDDSAWPQLRRLITTLENLSTPIDPDALAAMFDLNKVPFDPSNTFGYAGKFRDIRNSIFTTVYQTPINSHVDPYIHLSITDFSRLRNKYKSDHILILFDAKPINRACISFSSIKDDLSELKWDGIAPMNPTGRSPNVPLALPYYIISLGGPKFEDMEISIQLSKSSECLSQITGFVKARKS